MNHAYVSSLLLSRLAALGMGHVGAPPAADQTSRSELSAHLHDYAKEKVIYRKINFVNPEHVHALVDLPTNLAIEDMMQLFKGSSSHWVNEQNLITGKFGWARGYGVFSVSESGVAEVCAYIANQEVHHRKRDFIEELRLFVERYGLEWRKD